MNTTTTQSNFHPMRGHVSHGTTVRMNDGHIWAVVSTMRGWTLIDEKGNPVCGKDLHATDITDRIVNA